MANQKVMLKVLGRRTGPQDIRVVLVDSDGGAATFTDNGASTFLPLEDDFKVLDCVGQGTTAPATATSFQVGLNRVDQPWFINGANTFSATSSGPGARIGALVGQVLPKGSTLRITGRA